MKQAILIVCVAVVAGLGSVVSAVEIETVPVGNVGNAGEQSQLGNRDDRYYGAVDYKYNIGKYEVTAGQYCEFLNAVAKADAYGLYDVRMDSVYFGCQITRHGTSGNYTYDFSGGTAEATGSTATDWDNRPVNYVSWGDAARFANWLHNGQPMGTLTGNPAQDVGLTEDGAYDLNGATSDADLLAISREADWKWAVPTEHEWYKAAYHKNDGTTGNYFGYPTSSNSLPSDNLIEPTDPGNNATFSESDYTIGSPYYRTGREKGSELFYMLIRQVVSDDLLLYLLVENAIFLATCHDVA